MRSSSFARRFVGAAAISAVLAGAVTVHASAAEPRATATVAAAPAGTLTTITPGLTGFDSKHSETPTDIACLSAEGFSYDIVDTIGPSWQDEYNAAAAGGMKVVLFQGYDPSSWAKPEEASNRATIARDKALTAKYPRGGQIFLDVEDNVNRGVTGSQMITWINNWTSVIRNAGYSPGIYLGAPQLLSRDQINTLPNVVFWRAPSGSVPQAARGFVAKQTEASTPTKKIITCGITDGIDIDVAGQDGAGVQLTGAAFPVTHPTPTVPGAFVPLSPSRVLDTRSQLGGSTLGSTQTENVQITGRGGVPASGATAVVLNVTVTNPVAAGYLSVYPTTTGDASVSSLNFAGGQTVANLVTVQLGSHGQVTLYNGSPGTADLIGDVAGYYVSGTAAEPGAFTPVKPARLLDTRPHPEAAIGTATVQTASRGGLPASGYDSVVMNLTAVAPAAPGFFTAYPAGVGRPTASSLNFPAGRTVPNMATVGVDQQAGAQLGQISVFNGSAGPTNVLADVAGYYLAGTRAAADGGVFTPTSPTRILDTRTTSTTTVPASKVPASSAISLAVAGHGGVPATASAVVLNVTVTGQTAAGYVTVFPSDRSTPNASNINFVPRVDIANQVIVPLGADGHVVLYNRSSGTTDLLADVAGYFQG